MQWVVRTIVEFSMNLWWQLKPFTFKRQIAESKWPGHLHDCFGRCLQSLRFGSCEEFKITSWLAKHIVAYLLAAASGGLLSVRLSPSFLPAACWSYRLASVPSFGQFHSKTSHSAPWSLLQASGLLRPASADAQRLPHCPGCNEAHSLQNIPSSVVK